MVLEKGRISDKWNRIESPELIPQIYDQQIYYKEAKYVKWGKENVFNKC